MHIKVNIKINPISHGKNCQGNGKHKDNNGKILPCLCDECDYLMYCVEKSKRHLK